MANSARIESRTLLKSEAGTFVGRYQQCVHHRESNVFACSLRHPEAAWAHLLHWFFGLHQPGDTPARRERTAPSTIVSRSRRSAAWILLAGISEAPLDF